MCNTSTESAPIFSIQYCTVLFGNFLEKCESFCRVWQIWSLPVASSICFRRKIRLFYFFREFQALVFLNSVLFCFLTHKKKKFKLVCEFAKKIKIFQWLSAACDKFVLKNREKRRHALKMLWLSAFLVTECSPGQNSTLTLYTVSDRAQPWFYTVESTVYTVLGSAQLIDSTRYRTLFLFELCLNAFWVWKNVKSRRGHMYIRTRPFTKGLPSHTILVMLSF